MPKEYQNEKSPTIESQKSKKTRRKLLKMSHIKAFKVDQVFCNTRYKSIYLQNYTLTVIDLILDPCHCC